MNKTDLYIDLEWFFNQQIFLVGYAYSVTNYNQLYDENLNVYNIQQMLAPVNGYIYFYGPDIGMLEKNTGLDIRNNYRCVNLLKVFRDIMPGMDSYKLASFEEMFEINRSQRQYKSNIFKLAEDWNNPYKKQHVLKYNLEDVVNLVRLKKEIFSIYGIGEEYLEGVRWWLSLFAKWLNHFHFKRIIHVYFTIKTSYCLIWINICKIHFFKSISFKFHRIDVFILQISIFLV